MALRLEFNEGMMNGTHVMVTDGCERGTRYGGKTPEILLYCNVVVAMERFFGRYGVMTLQCGVCNKEYDITKEEFDARLKGYQITPR